MDEDDVAEDVLDIDRVVLHMTFAVISRLLANPADQKARAAARRLIANHGICTEAAVKPATLRRVLPGKSVWRKEDHPYGSVAQHAQRCP